MSSEKHQFNLPEFEETVLKFWEKNRIFERTLENTKKGKPFIFYEGPPTANGSPGIHHVEARAFKDLIPRYKTMRGFHVPRKAGWDTHGLPVEIQVEKELGLKTKQDIEQYGIAPFNAKAKESVWRYKEEWDRLTKRRGFWLDLEHPYIPYDPFYMESLWWIIKEFWKKKLLVEDFKVLPWCTRCQTGLSTHELAQGYKEIEDRSVYIRFPITVGLTEKHLQGRKILLIAQQKQNQKMWKNTNFLVWTTTPWTLPGNVGLAVNPEATYIRVPDPKLPGAWLILGKENYDLLYKKGIFLKKEEPQDSFLGIDLVSVTDEMGTAGKYNLRYEALFGYIIPTGRVRNFGNDVGCIYPASFVTTTDGTGIVHTAALYGEDDLILWRKFHQGPVRLFNKIYEDGRFFTDMPQEIGIGGAYAKNSETEKKIIDYLNQKNLFFADENYLHDYPHCWRCSTPILYYARKAWWIKTTAVKKELLANNETINWVPEHLKKGRFGEFLKDVRDWAFSRERYWGTPLPIWKCDACSVIEVIGSIEELRNKSVPQKNTYFFMRHGEAISNIRGITSSKGVGHKLTPRGRKQVEQAAKKLRQKNIDVIITSPILRAQETAEIISKMLQIPIDSDARLAEVNVGVLDGRKAGEYHAYFSSMEEKFIKRPPEGENLNDVRSRVLDFIEETEKKYNGKKILVISHEYLIWMGYAGGRGFTNEQSVMLRTGKRENDFIGFAEIIEMLYVTVPRDETGEVNLHRPFVDAFIFACSACGKGIMKRVPEVADVWFDSGAMPYAVAHYPFDMLRHPERSEGSFMQKKRDSSPLAQNDRGDGFAFPADYISEGVDQTRGWFYTLLVVATLLGKQAPYKHVISLGHVLDKNGQKMSKSKGNVVSPWDMIAKYGTDTLRWYFYAINSPGEPKRFDEKDLLLKQRSFLGTWWNSFVLFDTYVKKVENKKLKGKSQNILDRWILEKTNQLVGDVTKKLDAYDITGASRAIEQFAVADFSQWYLRRSRERFQRPRTMQEKREATETTAYALDILCRLTAPFTPFLSEHIYQELRKKTGQKEISVHLLDWPGVESRSENQEARIIANMEIVRDIVARALKLRAESGIKVRQPLQTLHITDKNISTDMHALIRDEVNIKEIAVGKDFWLDTVITPQLKEEGIIREFIRNIQEMRRDLGLTPAQKAKLHIMGDTQQEALILHHMKKIKKDANISELRAGGKKVFQLERELKLDEKIMWIGIS